MILQSGPLKIFFSRADFKVVFPDTKVNARKTPIPGRNEYFIPIAFYYIGLPVQRRWRIEKRVDTIRKPLRRIPVIFADLRCGFGLVGNTPRLALANRNNAVYTRILIIEIF